VIRAAEWVHLMRRRAARQVDPSADDPALAASSYQPCPTCKGNHGNEQCELCKGLGHVRPAEDEQAPDELVHAVLELGGFLTDVQLIQQHGLQAWLLMVCGPEPVDLHPDFVEALDVFQQHLEVLRHKDEVEAAKAARERQPRV
jgi:hypothetical protein